MTIQGVWVDDLFPSQEKEEETPKQKEHTVRSYYGMTTVQPKTSNLKGAGLFHDKLGKGILCGVEIEVEKCPCVTIPLYDGAVALHNDNSLRNNGVEVITAPINSNFMMPVIEDILKNLPTERDFSPRTSIHFHFNMQDWTEDQLKSLIYLYILFEPSLFNLVSPKRRESIFCVPIYDTDIHISSNRDSLWYWVENWHKYAAFNLKPLSSYGTVEFRHLQGTEDLETIRNWFYTIHSLVLFAKTVSNSKELYKQICQLNTDSMYEHFGHLVFKDNFFRVHNLKIKEEMELGVKTIKMFKRSSQIMGSLVGQDSYLRQLIVGPQKKPGDDNFLYNDLVEKYINKKKIYANIFQPKHPLVVGQDVEQE